MKYSLKETIITAVLIFTIVYAVAASSDRTHIVEHGPRGTKMIALTFDACPTTRTDEYDEEVVNILLRETVSATLFLSGRWVEKNKVRAKDLASVPFFEIGNHAFWHPHLKEKSDERVFMELKRTQDIIRKITGRMPRYFRAPFGEVDGRISRIAAEAGLVAIQYDIASGDPDPKLSAKRMINSIVGAAQGGSIIVFHMNRNGIHTAEVLPEVIKELSKRGFRFVTVGEMLAQ